MHSYQGEPPTSQVLLSLVVLKLLPVLQLWTGSQSLAMWSQLSFPITIHPSPSSTYH